MCVSCVCVCGVSMCVFFLVVTPGCTDTGCSAVAPGSPCLTPLHLSSFILGSFMPAPQCHRMANPTPDVVFVMKAGRNKGSPNHLPASRLPLRSYWSELCHVVPFGFRGCRKGNVWLCQPQVETGKGEGVLCAVRTVTALCVSTITRVPAHTTPARGAWGQAGKMEGSSSCEIMQVQRAGMF